MRFSLDDTRWVAVASVASFAIAMVFIFVWAPHPWGWNGFDQYHDLGRALAHGDFPTTDVPWGYAAFLAPFYRFFGNRPWSPLVVQSALNALIPVLVFAFAKTEFTARIGVAAALVAGIFSFNTVYASTQSSDAVCTVIFMTAVVAFTRWRRTRAWPWAVLAGVLFGLAPQFRPNLLLVPLVVAVFTIVERPRSVGTRLSNAPRAPTSRASRGTTSGFRPSSAGGAGLLGACSRFPDTLLAKTAAVCTVLAASTAVLMPWIVRNYRLTGEFIPTSTHGGVQLWYGTLQTGPYLKSYAYNPRVAFEAASFPYTSLDRVPLHVSARLPPCAESPPSSATLVYWTDRSARRVRVESRVEAGTAFTADMAPSPAPTAYYYYFDTAWVDEGGAAQRVATPPGGESAPFVYFVSADHLGDLDRHGDLLDVFDLVRLLRHVAWNEPAGPPDRLDFDNDGALTEADVPAVVDALLSKTARPPRDRAENAVEAVERGPDTVTLRLAHGSALTIPRQWSSRVTDIDVTGALAARLVHASVPHAILRAAGGTPPAECRQLDGVAVNAVYYRDQPHAMRRHMALALDNIRRNPGAYGAAVAYRALRVFFIEGSEDASTAQQFPGSGRVYQLAHAASIALFVVFVAGVWLAWRRGFAIALPLVLIAYIPATLAFVLTNMRYSITVQPLMFVFVATVIVTALDKLAGDRGGKPARFADRHPTLG